MELTKRILHLAAKPVEFAFPIQNLQLADQLLNFMRKNQGIGLAAPQVGIRKRLFVMDVDGWPRVCFNPKITGQSWNLIESVEGCLSFPGNSCTIKRYETIDVEYQDYQGHVHCERLSGLLARCFQHELDHLDGITMYERQDQHAK